MRWGVTCILWLIAAAGACAQQDTTFALLATGSAGYGFNVSQEILLPKGADNFGPNVMLRLMWKPDHRLRVGLESGWMRCTGTEGFLRDSSGVPRQRSIYLDAIPILLTFSMNFDRININAGAGYYLMLSYILGFGEGVTSTQLNYGISASAEYLAPLTPALRIGGGVGVYGITQLGQYIATAQVRAEYRVMSW